MNEIDTPWWSYVQSVAHEATQKDIADRAGFDKSAISRWKSGLSADVSFIVAFARAYDRSPVEALAAAGIITQAEANLRESKVGLSDLTTEQLAAELLRRVKSQ